MTWTLALLLLVAAAAWAHSRFPSPKYLIGESYGTIRSAGLAQELQNRHGIELNGITLVSSLLTYQSIAPSPRNDVACASHLETYSATATARNSSRARAARRGNLNSPI